MTSTVLSLLTFAAGAYCDRLNTVTDASRLYRRAKDSVVAIEVTTPEGKAYGTGFFFGDGKTIATCNHVVEGATKILVHGTKGATWTPTSMSFDRSGDTVLLHLPATSNRQALGVAKGGQIGEAVFVIGNPLGMLTGSLSTGIVSANRKIDSVPLLQTTAPISEGSSGSPVLDQRGRVLGMVSFTFSEGQNLNMAIGSQVLSWVANGHHDVTLHNYYALNAMTTGRPLRMTQPAPQPEAPAPNPTEGAKKILVQQIAQYDGRVIDAFVRWQVAWMALRRGQGGLTAANVQDAYAAFKDEVGSSSMDQTLSDLARAAGQTDFYERLHSAGVSLLHVAEDKSREDLEVVQAAASPDVQKRADAQYKRLVQAICQFGAAGEDPSWMDIATLYANFPTAAKGECIMLHQNAFVDADLPRSTTIRDARDGSVFRTGDAVKGARILGGLTWTTIRTWEDLWQFTANQGAELCHRGWEVQVVRDGQTVSVPMCLAGKAR